MVPLPRNNSFVMIGLSIPTNITDEGSIHPNPFREDNSLGTLLLLYMVVTVRTARLPTLKVAKRGKLCSTEQEVSHHTHGWKENKYFELKTCGATAPT